MIQAAKIIGADLDTTDLIGAGWVNYFFSNIKCVSQIFEDFISYANITYYFLYSAIFVLALCAAILVIFSLLCIVSLAMNKATESKSESSNQPQNADPAPDLGDGANNDDESKDPDQSNRKRKRSPEDEGEKTDPTAEIKSYSDARRQARQVIL